MKIRRKQKKVSVGTSSPANFGAAQLLEKAQEFVDRFEFDLAMKFFERALSQEPNNTQVLDAMGETLANLGDTDKAKELFGRSIQLDPASNSSKWMYMGQLSEGLEAVNCYKKAIEMMFTERSQAASLQKEDEVKLLNRQISTAFCAAAEIFLTDSCFESNAENECNACLEQALQNDPTNPEVYQALSSLRMSQCKNDEAAQYAVKAVEILRDCDENTTPPYASRSMLAKMLVELQRFEEAVEVIDGLVDEDDEDVEAWYLLAFSHHGLQNYLSSKDCVTRAKELLNKGLGEPAFVEPVDELLGVVTPLCPSEEEAEMAEDGTYDDDEEDAMMD